MPRRKRTPKKRIDILTWEQEMNILIGGKTLDELQREGYSPQTWQTTDGVFQDDEERKQAWLEHRDELMSGREECPPVAYYDYESPNKNS